MSTNQILSNHSGSNLNNVWAVQYNYQYNELENIENIASKAEKSAIKIIEENFNKLTNEEQEKFSGLGLWAAHRHGNLHENHVMVKTKVVDQSGITTWETQPENLTDLFEKTVQATHWIGSDNKPIAIEYSRDPLDRIDSNQMEKVAKIVQDIFSLIKNEHADKYLGICLLKNIPLQDHVYVEHTKETEGTHIR